MSEIIDRIKAVKERYDLRDYLTSEWGLKGATTGHMLKVPCPFHAESNPSLAIYADGYYCYGCGERGDILDWVGKRLGLDVRASLELLEGSQALPEIVHVAYPKPEVERPIGVGRFRLVATLRALFEEGAAGLAGSPAQKYCESRGWSERTQKAFGLGYFSYRSGDSEAFADTEALEQIGLLDKNGWPWFNHRLFIPLHDPFGQPVAIATRKLKDDTGSAKYVNSRRSDLFKRNETVYGAHLLPYSKGKEVWIVEGYADVWSLYEIGVPAVAVMTSRMSERQAEWIVLMALTSGVSLKLVFDGDEAGQAGMKDAVEKMSAVGDIASMELEPDEDVSSYIERERRVP